MISNPRRTYSLYLIAFFSGAVSLISQLVALRIATQELTATPFLISALLATALLGLSLGSFLLGRTGTRAEATYRLALCYLFFATLGTLFVVLVGRIYANWLIGVSLPTLVEPWCYTLALVFPVNFLIGGVVPVVTQSLVSTSPKKIVFQTVYSIETLGAATGSLFFSLFLLPRFGLTRASWIFVSMTIASVVLVHWITGRREPSLEDDLERVTRDQSKANEYESDKFKLAPWIILLAVFVGSFASLGMELIWQRWFAIVFGSDTQSYSVVAAVFLVGMSLGAWCSPTRHQQSANLIYRYSLMLIVIGGSLVGSFLLLKLGFQVETLRSSLSFLAAYPLLSRVVLAAAIVACPSILIGMAFPTVVQYWVSNRPRSVGSSTGQIYGWAIFGNVVGLVLCGSWLIPVLGLKNTSLILAIALQLLGGALWFACSTTYPSIRARRGWTIALGIFACVGFSVYQSTLPFHPGLNLAQGWKILRQWEQASQTVAVIQSTEEPAHKRLLIDGVTIGESGSGVDEKQQMLAHLPIMLRPHSKSHVLTIGLGSGILAGEVAKHSQVKSVTCVELSRPVIEAAKLFSDHNHGALDNPKLDVIHGDGVRYLKNSQQAFDIIISDGKTRPGGASNLPFFSREYYQLCHSRLGDGGIFIQWVSLRSDPDELKTILRTFGRKFNQRYLAFAFPDSIYLVGTEQPIEWDLEWIETCFEEAEGLRFYHWQASDDILAMYWLTNFSHEVLPLAENHFDHPILERFAWKSFRYSVVDQTPQLQLINDLLSTDQLESPSLPEDELYKGRMAAIQWLQAEQTLAQRDPGWLDKSGTHFKEALLHLPQMHHQHDVVSIYRQLAAEAEQAGDLPKLFSCLANINDLQASTYREDMTMGEILVANRAIDRALSHFYRAVKKSNGAPEARLAFGQGLLLIGKLDQAIAQFAAVQPPDLSKANSLSPLQGRALVLQGIAWFRKGQPTKGRPLIDAGLKAFPELRKLLDRY